MDITVIKKRLEREQARQREAARKAQALGAKLSTVARANDTRRKILAGSWALDKIAKSEEFRAMMLRELDKVWLSRDDDRVLFGLSPLSDEEKARRDIPSGKRGGKNVPRPEAVSPDAADRNIRQREEETEAA